MRACGDEQVPRDARVDTRIRARTGMGSRHSFVAAFLRLGKRSSPGLAPTSWLLRTSWSCLTVGTAPRIGSELPDAEAPDMVLPAFELIADALPRLWVSAYERRANCR
jgi:hypothetical protein